METDLHIGGKFVAGDGEAEEIVNPATGAMIARISLHHRSRSAEWWVLQLKPSPEMAPWFFEQTAVDGSPDDLIVDRSRAEPGEFRKHV